MTANHYEAMRGAWRGGTALFSEDGFYRYDLTRRWGDGPLLLWCMLNPSTADATKDDPTIRRCIRFSQRDGFGGLVIVNLYAMRTTRPVHLTEVDDPTGPDNGATIAGWMSAPAVSGVVCAWGAWPDRRSSPPRLMVETMATEAGHQPVCLGTTQDGAPRHPLYVKGTAPLVAWP